MQPLYSNFQNQKKNFSRQHSRIKAPHDTNLSWVETSLNVTAFLPKTIALQEC